MRVRQSLSWLVALLVVTALVAGTAGSAAAAQGDMDPIETRSTIGASSTAYHCWTSITSVGVLAIFEYAERLSDPPSLHTCSPSGPTFPVG